MITARGKSYALFLFFLPILCAPTCLFSDEISEAEMRELQRGNIPQRLQENWRVVPPRSNHGRVFQREMEALIHRVYNHNFQQYPTRFLLLDNPGIEAFAFPNANPPIIAISTGILNRARHREHLEYVLGHEWAHWEARQTWGPSLRISKGEELGADVRPLFMMADAGSDPREARAFAGVLFGERGSPSWGQFFDVHPLDHNRLRVMDDFNVGLGETIGGFQDRSGHPLSEGIRGLQNQTGMHLSFVNDYVTQARWATLNPEQKANVLSRLIRDTTVWNQARFADLLRLIRELNLESGSETHREAMDRLANHIYDLARNENHRGAATRLYYALGRYRARSDILPLGRLRPIGQAMRDFVNATTRREAHSAATGLLRLINAESLSNNVIRQFMQEAPQFDFPEIEYAEPRNRRQFERNGRVAWQRHTRWATERQSLPIMRALLLLNIQDHRLYENMPADIAIELQQRQLRPVSNGPGEGSATPAHLQLSERGRVRRLKETPHDFEQRIQAITATAAEQAFERAMQTGDTIPEDILRGRYDRAENTTPQLTELEHLHRNPELFYRYHERLLRRLASRFPNDLLNTFRDYLQSGDAQRIEIVRNFFLSDDRQPPLQSIVGDSGQTQFGVAWDPQLSQAEERTSGRRSHFLRNPYFRFIFENPNNVFTPDEQKQALQDGQFLSGIDPAELPEQNQQLAPIRQLFGYQHAPTNLEELKNTIRSLSENSTGLKQNLQAFEIYHFYHLNDENHSSRSQKIDLDWLAEHLPAEIVKDHVLIRNLVRQWTEETTRWPNSAVRLTRIWSWLNRTRAFPIDGALERTLLTRTLDRIENLRTPQSRFQQLENLLASGRIMPPQHRRRLMNLWASAIRDHLGTDSHTNDREKRSFNRRLQSRLDWAHQNLSISDRTEALALLADRIQAQGELAESIRQNSMRIERGALEGSQLKGMAIEMVIYGLARSSEYRLKLIDFFVTPLSEFSVDQIYRAMVDYDSGVTNRVTEFVEPQLIRTELRTLWENFYAFPFEARAVALEEILFPDDSEETLREGLRYVIEKLLPDNLEHSREARLFLNAYANALDSNAERRLFLSAAMVATEQSAHEAGERQATIGERLALVLEVMGPAETRVGQQAHGHPQTPGHIRQGLGRLKSRANPPLRWQLMDWYRDNVPENLRNRIRHVHNILGSASYWVVVEVEMNDGTRRALAIPRPHALRRSQRGFERMGRMLDNLRGDLDRNTIDVIRQMVDQAREQAEIETNSNHSARQTNTARRLYHGNQIRIGNRVLTLNVPQVLEAGESHRLMELAPGDHFYELPEETRAQRTRKRNIAEAYFTFELYLLLKGDNFDYDRHGGQMRVEGNTLHLLDWGRMSLNPPSPAQLRQLGEVIFDVIVAINEGRDLNEVVFAAIRARDEAGEDVSHLIKVQQALLALGDFHRNIPTARLPDLIRAVANTGHIHSEVMAGVFARAMNSGANLQQILSSFATEGSRVPCEIILSAPH